MDPGSQDILLRDYSTIQDREKLREILADVQLIGKSLLQSTQHTKQIFDADAAKLQHDVQTLQKRLEEQYHNLSCYGKQGWIIAEQDYPDEKSLVVLYEGRELKVTNSGALTGSMPVYLPTRMLKVIDCRAIASKFPSRWPRTVYIYTEVATSTYQDHESRVRVSTKKVAPDGLRRSKALHLNKLPLGTKVRILTGQIKWLFVVQHNSRKSTNSSEMTD